MRVSRILRDGRMIGALDEPTRIFNVKRLGFRISFGDIRSPGLDKSAY